MRSQFLPQEAKVTLARYAKRDLCNCGYGVLKDSVEIGKLFKVEIESKQDAILVCGGCGTKIAITVVRALQEESSEPFGYLPLEILEIVG